MTQMTQSPKPKARAGASLLGHLGHAKTMTQMTQDLPACMAMQFKTMTQMTQMTQGHADVLTWCMLAPAGNMWHGGQWPPARSAAGRWQYPQCQ